MATGTLVHSLGSMNLSPMIHEGSKWHFSAACSLQLFYDYIIDI